MVVGDRIEAYAISCGSLTAAAELAGPPAGRVPRMFLQGYIQLTANSPGVLTPIELPQTDAGPFLSYALQWAAFGVIALIGLGVFIYREAPIRDRRTTDEPAVPSGAMPDGAGPGLNRRPAAASARRGTASTAPSSTTSDHVPTD